MLKQTGEKPDLKLSACVWRGPYASCAVKEEDKTTEIFELTEDGRLAAVEWIRQQYESRLDYWEAAPSITVSYTHLDYVWQLQALPRILWFQVRNRLNNSLMRLKCHIKNLFQNQVHLLADTEKYMKQMKYTE